MVSADAGIAAATAGKSKSRCGVGASVIVALPIADIDAQIAAVDTSTDDSGKDRQRLRSNLSALKGPPEERLLVKRYTDGSNTQERRIGALHNGCGHGDSRVLRQKNTSSQKFHASRSTGCSTSLKRFFSRQLRP
jgi:hypothetical protein